MAHLWNIIADVGRMSSIINPIYYLDITLQAGDESMAV